jgi:hypothetical protein
MLAEGEGELIVAGDFIIVVYSEELNSHYPPSLLLSFFASFAF